MSPGHASEVEPFDAATMPLHGTRLVEASAGTGKTYSLASLYLRLIVEQGLDVREILVMTFTRAATQELRERLRARLARAAHLAALPAAGDHEDSADTFAETLIAGAVDGRARLAVRLREAACSVDQATITTIHGFAQRAAAENAFESALPFDRGEQTDDASIYREAAADYWRSRVFGRGLGPAAAFVALWPSPEALYRDIVGLLDKPHARLLHPASCEVRRDRAAALEQWPETRSQLGALLQRALQTGAFKSNQRDKYHNSLRIQLETDGIEGWLNAIDQGLQGTLDGYPALPPLLTDLGTAAGVAKHVKKAFSECFRPQDMPLVAQLAKLQVDGRLAALSAASGAIGELAAARKRERRLFSFGDMITGLHAALTDAERGPALASALHQVWPWALIDEFQDTDPLQYTILRKIFCRPGGGDQVGAARRERGGLILIGDPKQAIYGFRGGDVFAYLDAAADADGRYGMDTNYRSTPAVVEGLNTLFSARGESAFVLEGIDFRPVAAGTPAPHRGAELDGVTLPGVTAWTLPNDWGPSKKDLVPALQGATVERIVALLDRGTLGRDDEAHEPIRPRDIAVLVNTNTEAAQMQTALGEAGVPAVCVRQDSVLASAAARDMLHLLRAVATPFDSARLRVALSTPLFGYRLGDLAALDADDTSWAATGDRFQAAHLQWSRAGVQAMLDGILQEAAPRILSLTDGERRMTDYLHLADLLQHAEHEVFGMTGVLRWLEHGIQRAATGEVGDTDRVRLADDTDLVQVTTVHKAKGLQFPLVFVPYTPWLGTGGAPPGEPPLAYHDDNRQAVLDLGTDPPAARSDQAVRERRAEQVRLLYVALTRAQHTVYFVHAAATHALDGPVTWLLRAAEGVPAHCWHGHKKLPDWFNAEHISERLQALTSDSNGGLAVEELVAPHGAPQRQHPEKPADIGPARQDLPAPRRPWSIYSFSRLASGMATPVEPTVGGDDEPKGGDPEPTASAPEIAAQPRGRGFGQAFHALMEEVRFTSWPEPGDDCDEAMRGLVAAALRRHGVPTNGTARGVSPVQQTLSMACRCAHASLPGIGPLTAVPSTHLRREMEFFLRLGGSRAQTVLDEIATAGYRGARSANATSTLRGLMHGYIDLIVEREGRYWIIDYKTNALGPQKADYSPDRLATAIAEHRYDLQYLIYSVALHRQLRRLARGRDYHPARQLGGVLYLFVRGMDAGATHGVFVDRPDAHFIERLDALFDGAEDGL